MCDKVVLKAVSTTNNVRFLLRKMHLSITFSIICIVIRLGSSFDGDVHTVCEHETMSISCCDDNYVLSIIHASYGRHDSTTCASGKAVLTTNCEASKSLEVLKQKCNGESECSFDASNSVFGDPCSGTFKYLTVTYVCLPLVEETDLVCEHDTISMSCDGGDVLSIRSASYGRHDATTCPSPFMLTTTCEATNSLTLVQQACNGKSSCSVKASNTVFGDPCIFTYKYLSVGYDCVDKVQGPVVVCEHDTISLSCDNGGLLSVLTASYGRHDGVTCPSPFMLTTTCEATNSLTVVQQACNGKSSCSVKASNSVFGDPCILTYKYLSVEYECL
ncbi:L-rhamnose-binding lectin CSL3-like isoform X2 [Glandiceps talaboti]